MAKNRTIIHLECTDCGERNYSQRVSSKKRESGKLMLKKYCWRCKKHHNHKETK